MTTFENIQAGNLLRILKNFKTTIDGTRTTTVAGQINYLHRMLCIESQRQFYEMSTQKNGRTNANLKQIQVILIR